MVVEILVALAAAAAICHTHHKKQRINDALRRDYEARNGAALTKDEWKQLCRDRKQAAKAEKRARKAEAKHMRRGCWRTSVPAQAQAQEMDVKYDDDNVGAKDDDGYAPASGDGRIWIPVRGPEEEEEEEPPAYTPGTVTVPQKM
ncbi:hypothetical protein MY11210_000933 [Beauveria gryllotalpidicola]